MTLIVKELFIGDLVLSAVAFVLIFITAKLYGEPTVTIVAPVVLVIIGLCTLGSVLGLKSLPFWVRDPIWLKETAVVTIFFLPVVWAVSMANTPRVLAFGWRKAKRGERIASIALIGSSLACAAVYVVAWLLAKIH